MEERGALEELPLAEELLTVDGSWWRENYFSSGGGMWLQMVILCPSGWPHTHAHMGTIMGLSGLFK